MEFENQYLTYEEYVELGGTLDETPFNILEFEAQLIIDNYTYGRLKNLDEQRPEVKLCIMSLIPNLKVYADLRAKDRSISSENIDGYSVSYVGISADLTVAETKQVQKIIDNYLGECKLNDGTPYLYIGR